MRISYGLVLLLLFAGLFCGCNEYTPQTTEEAAIEAALADGQKFFVEEFVEWQEWPVRTAEFRTVEVENAFDKQYDTKEDIWHVIIGMEDDSRSIHFVVTDDGKKVIGGWDSLAVASEYRTYAEKKGLISMEDAMLRAIVFRNVVGVENGPWRYVVVSLSSFSESDKYSITRYRPWYTKFMVPVGEEVWNIRFCNHAEDKNEVYHGTFYDCTVSLRASNGKVYRLVYNWMM